MSRGHKRPKKNLRFSIILDVLQDAFEKIEDDRDPERICYQIRDIYTAAFAMFYFQDKSLLEFQRQLENKYRLNNLTTAFNVSAIPKDSQLRDTIDNCSYETIISIFKDYFSRLQRGKYLDRFQILGGKYLVTIDGSVYFSSNKLKCEKCLTKEHANGKTTYHHQILQATIVHPDMKQVIPLSPEFIRNGDGGKKQDCEINAGKRLIHTIKKDHPRLPMIIVGDSLYSKGPFVKELISLGYSFILVAKPEDHKSLYSDIEGLRQGDLLDTFIVTTKKRTYTYEWSNSVYLNSSKDSPKVTFFQLTITDAEGKITYRSAWVTDMEITCDNIEEMVRAARARWKIENECFNTLKNQGYHINHNFGHGKKNLSEAFFLLNLLAFFLHQIFELSDTLYQSARATFSARVEYWNTIRAAFRLILFDSWEELLVRINSPPELEDIQRKRKKARK
jgi:hypothetical protein